MKKLLVIALFLIFSLSPSLYSYKGYFKFRTYGSLGYTGGGNVNVGDGSLLNYRVGIQPFYQFSRKVSIGLDLGIMHSFTTDYSSTTETKGRSRFGKSRFFYSLVVLEFSFAKNILLFQAGVGPYFGLGDNTQTDIGFMLTPGIDIPIGSHLSLPILNRFEFIFSEHTLIPLNLMAGITYRFR
ncbi:MAG: hypothetical protein IEMM0008_1849 [bacterium]|nr:MAG: hypothetical protein IEMM0008_1849 [bacterium]